MDTGKTQPAGRASRCLLCYPARPFVRGGTEAVVTCLAERLGERGFQVDTVALPSLPGAKTDALHEALQWSSLDLAEAYPDALVITTKFPSYLLHHPRKVVWLFHQYREIYDLYGDPLSSFKNEVLDHDIRQTLMRLDKERLGGCHRLYSLSATVAGRLKDYLGLEAPVLRPPSPLSGRLESGPLGDYVLVVSRLDENKRVGLFLEALARSERIQARIAGDGPLRERLEGEAKALGLSGKVEFLGRVEEEHLIELYSRARAVFVGPLDEDYGLVTVEALGSGRPVVATTDSGGPLELVEHEVTGLVVEPRADEAAKAFERLLDDDALCRRLGDAGRERVRQLRWEDVVRELTS